jgi:meso-butanediol dehydrogenase/(S,S)-butanediol dehydrogenase/diacetyl reductase
MGKRVDGRTILITGAASGIGAAIARGCAEEGANVVLADLNLDAANAVVAEISAAGGSALAVKVDVVDRASIVAAVAAAVGRFGRLDVYFNNAGMNSPMKFLDITEDNFTKVMNVNALGVLIGTQEAVRQFLAQGPASAGAVAGKVINTASIAGRTGFPNFAPYSAAKAAIDLADPGGGSLLRGRQHHGQRVRAGRCRDPALDPARQGPREDRRR